MLDKDAEVMMKLCRDFSDKENVNLMNSVKSFINAKKKSISVSSIQNPQKISQISTNNTNKSVIINPKSNNDKNDIIKIRKKYLIR